MSVEAPIFGNLPEIQTERLLLRKFTFEDAEDLFECTSDPEVNRYMLFTLHQTVEDAKKFIATYANRNIAPFAIVEKAKGKFIGQCGFITWDQRHSTGVIGYFLAQSYWGQGYMGEALQAVLGYGFNGLHLNRVEAQIDPLNTGSIRLVEKLGLKYEGTLRQNVFVKGNFEDSLLYSILRSEWQS